MDGTLLNSEGIITEENEAALKKLQQKGIEVMIASGRLDLMVKRYIQQLDLTGHVISCNGGLIRNIKTREIVYSCAMDKCMVREILTHCIENQIDFLVYTAQIMFANKNNPRALRYEILHKEIAQDLQFEVKYLEDSVMKDIEELDVLKILLILDNQEQVDYYINRYSEYEQLEVVSSSLGLVDIMAANTTKGKAIKILAEKQKVKLEEIIAFGDNYNDLTMLQCVGMPIAMENSVDEIKVVAKYITKSNDESGVAYAINQLKL